MTDKKLIQATAINAMMIAIGKFWKVNISFISSTLKSILANSNIVLL